tara:strand:+ start:1219 stop:1884 length:666 start_codon:yes stop_codon:yes gene_type:complete
MRILIIGATGRTGKLVLRIALEQGYKVNCLARFTNRIKKREGLKIFEGNPTNEIDLKKAIFECDYVISVINISRKSEFPWARLRSPKTFISDVMTLVVKIAGDMNIKRISTCSAWGVSETKKDIPKWFNWFINNSNIGIAYEDHERQEKIISESNLNWTIVRPVGLTNSKKAEKIIESINNKPRPSILISRESVARYLVESLENSSLIGKKVVISKGLNKS